jgi:hypothetical protein
LILKFGNLALFKSFGNGHPGYGTTIGGWKFDKKGRDCTREKKNFLN